MSNSAVLILSLICTSISNVICVNEPCDPDDNICVTEIGRKVFADFVLGRPGVDTSDPIHEDLIEAHLPKIWYKFTDCNFSGMKNCHFDYMKISKDKKYKGQVSCPRFTMDAGYEVKGDAGSLFVEGKGKCTVNFYDYNITFIGEYEMKNGGDNKVHVYLINQNLDFDTGRVEYDYKNLFNGDKIKSDAAHKWANENWEQVHVPTRQPVMQAIMNKYIKNINAYLGLVPFEELMSLK